MLSKAVISRNYMTNEKLNYDFINFFLKTTAVSNKINTHKSLKFLIKTKHNYYIISLRSITGNFFIHTSYYSLTTKYLEFVSINTNCVLQSKLCQLFPRIN